MRKFLMLVVASLVAISVSAAVKSFSWIPPTTYEDGSPLPTSEIAGYTLRCNDGARNVVAEFNGPVTSANHDLPPGSWICTLETRATTTPLPSDPSDPVSFTVPRPRPSAPAGFSGN